MKTQNPARTEIFEVVADEFTQALRNGDNPSIDDYATEHPEVADKIRLLFPMLAMMERGESSGDELPRFVDPFPASQPDRLGDFQIEREIGRGGMGVVYQAVQESLGRRVALKLLAQNLLDERSAERFEQEARVVANLHHTNIVPVYGIGQHEGYAYFVMQYIEGQSLDRVLVELQKIRDAGNGTTNKSDLSQPAISLLSAVEDVEPRQSTRDTGTLRRDPTDANLSRKSLSADSNIAAGGNQYWINAAQVGRQIASALSYAHSQKILHRDIKPSNLILDEAGSVWVTDFGLARTFESDRLTRTGEVVGTLRYMPPEQMAGQSDVRSDVYGLGLTLYEMLTLLPANDESDHRRLIAQVTEGEPIPPRRIDSRIPRDLETIVLKCITREPEKRYQTADDVHSDLTRFICGEPVQARRISTTERIIKWAKRRPAVAALAGLAILLASLGVAGITWKWREADRNFREAEKQNEAREVYFSKLGDVIDRMLARVGSETLADVPYMTQIRTALLTDALVFYRSLQQEATDDPALQIEHARIQRQMGDIHISLGEIDPAIEQLTLAVDELEGLRKRYPEKNLVIHWADSKGARANLLLSKGLHDEAETELNDAIRELEQCEDVVGNPEIDGSNPVGWLQVMAEAHMALGIVRQSTQGNSESTESLEKALSYFDQIPDNIDLVTPKMHASCLDLLARMLERTNKIPRAIILRNEAIDIIQEVVEADPQSPDARNRLANFQQAKGAILVNDGELERARPIIRESIDIRRRLVKDFPFPSFWRDLADCLAVYAGVLESLGDFESAFGAGEEAVQICNRLVADFPDSVIHQHALARNSHTLATITTRMNKADEQLNQANQYYEKSWDIYRELTELAPRDQAYQYERALVARNWSNAIGLLDEQDPRAIDLLQQAIGIFGRLEIREPENTTYVYQLAFCRTNLGKQLTETEPEQAAREFATACQSFSKLIKLQPNDPRHRMQLTRGYGELSKLQFRLGNFDDCVNSLQQACANMEKTVRKFGKNASLLTFLSISQNQLAHGLKVKGDTAQAEELFQSAYQDRAAFLLEHPDSAAGKHHLASSHSNLAWQLSYWRDVAERDHDSALEHALKATELDREASGLWTCLAHVHLRMREYDKVLEALEGCETDRAADEMGQLALRSMALWHLSKKDEAQEALAKAVTLRESDDFQNDIPARLWSPELARLVNEASELIGENDSPVNRF